MKLNFDKLSLLAAKHCWSLAELSKKAGVTSSALYHAKATGKPVRNKTLGKLAMALGVEPQDIMLQE